MNDITKKCFDLTNDELENGLLADLAKELGYSSLKSLLNNRNLWSVLQDDLKNDLMNEISQVYI